ncbi:uncharacterized protein LOC141499449 [Macrotis lagotis]|uniref:uncharacterized protein LOC141499449 n=1 Tax=Macrotis lagotis TaxID=92651 RepID=UPI003D681CA1
MMELLNFSGFFFSNFVIVFILLLKKPTVSTEQLSVIGPSRPIQALLGGEVELSCYLSPPQSTQHMEIVWLQSTWVIHLYRDGEDHFGDQDPDYQGRTELVRDGITNGNVTLKIRNVRLLDAGRYKCLFEDGFHLEEADMEVLGEGIVSQMLPPTHFFFIGTFWFILYVIFLFYMLLFQVYFRRSSPWMGEISGLLLMISTLEIEMAICFLWLRHRCRGILFDETSLWKEWKFWLSIALLVLTNIIPSVYQLVYFCQRRKHRTQSVCCLDYELPSWREVAAVGLKEASHNKWCRNSGFRPPPPKDTSGLALLLAGQDTQVHILKQLLSSHCLKCTEKECKITLQAVFVLAPWIEDGHILDPDVWGLHRPAIDSRPSDLIDKQQQQQPPDHLAL